MKLFQDDRELVKELLADKGRLIQENQKLKEHLATLIATMQKLADGLKQIQQIPATRAKIPIPDYLANDIDWQRLGMEKPDKSQLLQGDKRR